MGCVIGKYYFDPYYSNTCYINKHTRCPNCHRVFHLDIDPDYPKLKPTKVYWDCGGYCIC